MSDSFSQMPPPMPRIPGDLPAFTNVQLEPARDPFVDRARSIYLYVVAFIAFYQGAVLAFCESIGHPAKPMSLAALGIIVSPAVVFMFGKSLEQAIKARKAGPA